MTRRHHRRLFAPKRHRPWAVDSDYGVTAVLPTRGQRVSNPAKVLDATRLEVMPRFHRDASGDDPWISPTKSEAIQALLILIESAQVHAPLSSPLPDDGLDLEAFCQDAELTERQTQVVLLAGEGCGVVEIGRVLNLHHSTVEQHLRYGRHKLAGWLPVEFGRALVALAV